MLNYQRVNPPFFHFLGLSCKFSLKPIHWMLKHPVIQQWKNAQHNCRGRAPWMTCAILWGSSRSTLPSWAAMGNSHSYDMRNDIAAPKWIERIEKLRDVENWTMWGGKSSEPSWKHFLHSCDSHVGPPAATKKWSTRKPDIPVLQVFRKQTTASPVWKTTWSFRWCSKLFRAGVHFTSRQVSQALDCSAREHALGLTA